MKLLDKIALNRLISIITNFILAVLKIFAPKDTTIPNLDKKPRFPWINKQINKVKKAINNE